MAAHGPRIRLIPEGDNRERLVCPECNYIEYHNPRIVSGVVATWQGKLLLCKRAIEPRYGYWTLPAGFLELGEAPAEGAVREAWEEARAKLRIIDLLAMYSIRHIGQVQMFYRAELTSADVAAGPESLEVKLFDFNALPDAKQIAFPTVTWAIQHYQQVRGQRVIAPFENPPEESKQSLEHT